MSSANQIVAEIFNAALQSVGPYESVKLHTDRIRQFHQDNNFKKLIVVGFGKAASAMAKAMENELPDLIEAGIVITKYGHNISEKWEVGSEKSKIKILEAGHPIPDEPGLNATKEIIDVINSKKNC